MARGGKKPRTLTAELAVTPNPVPAQSAFAVSGCKYTPNVGVKFVLYSVGVTAVSAATADAAGCLPSGVQGWATHPGPATLEAWEGDVRLVARLAFEIV